MSFVSATQQDFASSASWDVTKPAAFTTGRFGLIVVVTDSAAVVNTKPVGWDLVAPAIDQGTDTTLVVYSRLATGGADDDPSAIAFAASEIGSTSFLIYDAIAFAASEIGNTSFLIYDGETVVDQVVTGTIGSATTAADGPDVTPTGTPRTIVGIYGSDPAVTQSGLIGGTGTERVDHNNSLSAHIYVADYAQVVAAPISLNWTAVGNDTWACMTIALAAALGGGSGGGSGGGPGSIAVAM